MVLLSFPQWTAGEGQVQYRKLHKKKADVFRWSPTCGFFHQIISEWDGLVVSGPEPAVQEELRDSRDQSK